MRRTQQNEKASYRTRTFTPSSCHSSNRKRKRMSFQSFHLLSFVLLLSTQVQFSMGNSQERFSPAPLSTNMQQRPPLLARLRQWSRRVLSEETSFPRSNQSQERKEETQSPLPKNSETQRRKEEPALTTEDEQDDKYEYNYLLVSDEEGVAEESSPDVQGKHNNNNVIPLIMGAVDSLLSDPRRLAQLSLKAVQYSLIYYLTKTLWKAMSEVMDELNSEDSLSADPLFCSRTELPRILQALEGINDGMSDKTKSAILPSNVMAFQLAMDLHNAGMPIRHNSEKSSIESLFMTLTKSEAGILRQCLWKPPPGLSRDEMWKQIVGLDSVKNQLLVTLASSGNGASSHLHKTQQAFAPLLRSHSGTNHHIGVLLYGEPGCGKSFLVRALAAKLGLNCLVVTPSVLMRKYVGDTNLQVRSLFSLLPKLSPCMVVLDELDGLFRERHDQEHDSSRELKTEFLQWLSGIMTSDNHYQSSLVVVGATNRPSDVDAAILRRLPQRFYIGLPDYHARCQLLKGLLSQVPGDNNLDISRIATELNGYTPSDIQQVLQTAVRMGPLQEAVRGDSSIYHQEARPLTTLDVLNAIAQTQPTPLSPRYKQALQQFANPGRPGHYGGGDESYSYSTDNSHFGPHFLNMGTVQVPGSEFLKDWQDSTSKFELEHEEEEEWDEDNGDDEVSDEDDALDDDDL